MLFCSNFIDSVIYVTKKKETPLVTIKNIYKLILFSIFLFNFRETWLSVFSYIHLQDLTQCLFCKSLRHGTEAEFMHDNLLIGYSIHSN